jgi:hypothetical protein
MPALDAWVTTYEGAVCGEDAYHIYRCVRTEQFDENVMGVGCTVPIDDSFYYVCGTARANPSEEEDWMLIYAHLIPQTMDESDWHGLYGDPELVSTG